MVKVNLTFMYFPLQFLETVSVNKTIIILKLRLMKVKLFLFQILYIIEKLGGSLFQLIIMVLAILC
nr:MAG TPA: hypothetical protein [Caudoviricetes sp.]